VAAKLWDAPSEFDLSQLKLQLQREPRDVLAVTARCTCGRPLVVATHPRLADGTPFPTFFYLTEPAATAAVSRLEASGWMRLAEQQLEQSEELRARYLAAHQGYLKQRDHVADVPEIAGISAGGMPTRVKCLHALVAHSLSVGAGVNPIGDAALEHLDWGIDKCQCSVRD
jgi:hypothetical protein